MFQPSDTGLIEKVSPFSVPKEPLAPLLQPGAYDVYAIGTQESCAGIGNRGTRTLSWGIPAPHISPIRPLKTSRIRALDRAGRSLFLSSKQAWEVLLATVSPCFSLPFSHTPTNAPHPKLLNVRATQTLGPGYAMVAAQGMAATHLAVFVRAGLLPRLSRVRSAFVPTGVGNIVKNKGGVGVCLCLGGAEGGSVEGGQGGFSALFVCAHLAAHQSKCGR